MRRAQSTFRLIRFTPRFFWQTCRACQTQFKGEPGWKVRPNASCDDVLPDYELCCVCAPHEDDAVRLVGELVPPHRVAPQAPWRAADNERQLQRRPPPPPAPPANRRRRVV